MKKLLSFIIIMGMVIGLAARPAAAEDKAKDELVIKARAAAGSEFVGETARSSKFFEYRDVPNGFIFKAFDLSLAKGNRYLTLNASRIRQRDGRYALSFGDYGKFKADFLWDKTPHRFSFFAKTLYVENQPGVFTLSDQIQTDLENIVGNGAANATAFMPLARAMLSNFLTGVHGIDIGLQRNKGVMNLEYTPSVPLTLSLNASRETRKGNRESGASFGFNHAMELPEPIDYVTTDLKATVEYAKPWGLVQAGYDASIFDNENLAMIWDNPYRITDQTYAGAYSSGNATSKGQMALWPSNNAQRAFFNGVVKLFKYTRITGTFSYGVFSQNDKLLPFTVNTALVSTDPAVGDPAALQAPRPTAMTKAHIVTFDLSLNSRLFKTNALSAYLNAGYRSYDFANKTEPLDMPGQARFDQVWESAAALGEPYELEPYSFMRSKAFADLSLSMVENTSLKFGYSRSWIERRVGAEVEGAEEDKSHEDMFKASADTNPVDWFMVRLSYLNSRRRRNLDGTDVIYSPAFNFKRYYNANRNRDAVNVLLGFSVIKNLDLELSYMRGEDTYPTADYGLKDNRFNTYSADLSYALGKTASVYGFYAYEVYKANQASRQSGATISTDPRNDWTAFIEDKVDTIGGGFNTVIVKNKLNLDLTYSYSRVKGTSSLFSPPGGTPNVAVNFTNNNLDTTKLQTLKAQLIWKFTSKISVAFGYWYEQYNLDDITRPDFKVDFVVTGFGMYLGALEPGYKYHVGTVKFIYSW